MLKISLPSWLTTLLALVAGVLQVLNQTTFAFTNNWKAALAVGLVFIAGLGIGPLTGAAFRAALHISQNLNAFISAALAAAVVAVTTISIDSGTKAVIMGVLTVLAGLGFGTVPGASVTPGAPPVAA